MSKANKALVRSIVDNIFNWPMPEDYDDLTRCVEEQIDAITPHIEAAYAPHLVGSVRAAQQVIRTAFPVFEYSIGELIAEGDLVSLTYEVTGRNDGPFMGLPPTGRELRVQGLVMTRIADGKVCEFQDRYDQLALYTTVSGAALPPDDGQDADDVYAFAQIKERWLIDEEHRMALHALDALRIPIGVIGPGGRVLSLNRAARAVIAEGDGVGVRDERIVFDDPAASRAFATAVRLATAKDVVPDFQGALQAERRSGRRQFGVLVMPLVEGIFADRSSTFRQPLALVCLQDPEVPLTTPGRTLTDLFGLTKAEAAVLARLGEGAGVEDIAATRGVRSDTVRVQLKSIYRKTGTRSRAELMLLLARSPAGVVSEVIRRR